MRIGSFLLVIAALAGPATAQDRIPPDIGLRIAEEFAIPAARDFSMAAETLEGRIGGLCETPSDEALELSRGAFARTVTAWGRVSALRFGPLTADNRFERVFFWPDPRGVILRQVQDLLAAEDPTAADPETLKAKSVAMQGLPSLEYLLWGTGAEALAGGDAPYRCAYARAIAGNLVAIAGTVEDEWREGAAFHADFTAPGAGNALYRDTREVASEFVKALGTGLQFMLNAELAPAVGAELEASNPRRAPLWRSGLTFALLVARIEGLDGLIAATRLEDDLPANEAGIVSTIRFDLKSIRNALAAIDLPVEAAFKDAANWERLRFAGVTVSYANRAVGEMLTGALGLSMGFNALDGD